MAGNPTEELTSLVTEAMSFSSMQDHAYLARFAVTAILANPDVVLRALGVPYRIGSDGTIITLVTELRKEG